MSEQQTRRADEQARFSGERVHVNVAVLVGRPATIVPVNEPQPQDFTEEAFEGVLDKVSRSVKGKYVNDMPSTEGFIRERREEEAKVEDR